MKRIGSFILAVILVMTMFAAVNVSAEILLDVQYYEGINSVTSSDIGGDIYVEPNTGSSPFVAHYNASNALNMNTNTVEISSQMVYDDWYRDFPSIDDKYSIYVDINCTINYILNPVPMMGHTRYLPNGSNAEHKYYLWYDELQHVSSIYIYHNVNNQANANSHYSTYSFTQVFMFV